MTVPVLDQSASAAAATVNLTHANYVHVYACFKCAVAHPASVTIGSDSMTQVSAITSAGVYFSVWFAYRSNPSTDTITGAAGPTYTYCCAMSFTVAAESAPYYELVTTGSGTGDGGVTIPAGTTDRLVLQNIATSAAVTPGSGQTEILDVGPALESNYEANSQSTLMDFTVAAVTWWTITFGILPSQAGQVIVLCGPRPHQPIFRQFQVYAWTKNFTIPQKSYVRITSARGAGPPGFYIRMADWRREAGRYIEASDIKAGLLNTIHLAVLADGEYKYMQFGLIETANETYGPFGREFEISGTQFGTALAQYRANGNAYSSRDIGDIIANPSDGLLTSIPEVGASGVEYPGVSIDFNPATSTSVMDSLNILTGEAGSATTQWRAYFCSSVHANETKRDTCHFEKIRHNLNPYIISMGEVMDVADSAPQLPWEAQQLASSGMTTKYEVGKAVVEYGTAGNVRVRGTGYPVKYYQLPYTSTSGEADRYGDQMIAIGGTRLMLQNFRLWGSLRYPPSNNVLFEDENRYTLMTTDFVIDHIWPQGWLQDVDLSMRLPAPT